MRKVDLSSGVKTCASCLQEKPVAEFYAQRHPGRKTAEAPRRDCKTCYNLAEYAREAEEKRLQGYVVRGWIGEVRAASEMNQHRMMVPGIGAKHRG